MSPQKHKRYVLQLGDVIATHPREGYFGIALVLAIRDATAQFDPQCLIGITPAVFTRPIEMTDVQMDDLAILRFDVEARTGPNTYAPLRREVCIRIHARKLPPSMRVLGQVDTSRLNLGPLGFDVGDGTSGRYPLYGPITEHLGSEAVIAWRLIQDRTQFFADREANRIAHQELLVRMKAQRRKPAPEPGKPESG